VHKVKKKIKTDSIVIQLISLLAMLH